MRSDYALYSIAIICFVLAAFFFKGSYVPLPPPIDIVIPVVLVILGLAFTGLGYMMRPEKVVSTTLAPKPALPAKSSPPIVKSRIELTKVKGIGPKKAEQLKGLGIDTVEDLANSSAKVLSSKIGVSQKIARRWIKEASKLVKESS